MKTHQIFICHSQTDKKWVEILKAHLESLQRPDEIQLFSDTSLVPDGESEKEITKALEQAPVALLLISNSFLTSEFIRKVELPRLLQRQRKEEISLVPIVLDWCNWRDVRELSELRMLPTGDRPLASLHSWPSGQAFDEILNRIKESLQLKKFGADLPIPRKQAFDADLISRKQAFQADLLMSRKQAFDADLPILRKQAFEENNASSGDPLTQSGHRTVLILASFKADKQDSYEKLAAVLQAHALKVMRIDDVAFQKVLSDPILEAIRRADVILCDLSSGSSNVYYELGMAHAMRKPTVLITERQSKDIIPTDLQGFLFWSYELSQPESLERVARRVLSALLEQEAGIDA